MKNTFAQRILADVKDSDWKKQFLKIMGRVSPRLATLRNPVDVDTKTASKLVEAFLKAGLEPYEQIDEWWVIDAPVEGLEEGIAIEGNKSGSRNSESDVYTVYWFKED